MKELLKELKPLKIKIILEIFVNWIIIGLMIGLGLSSIIIIISKFIFVDNILIKILLAFAIGLVFGLIMSVIKRPNIKKVAIIGDALGFKERFVTAIEILNSVKKDEPISKLVIKDALETAKNADFKSLYKINISNKRYITLALAILVIVVSGFMPSWKSEQIKKQAELQQNINNIEELSNKSKNAELKKELKELKKELKKSKTTSEIVKAIQKTQQQLKKIQNQSVAKDLKELGEKLSENELTKALGESLNSASSENIKDLINKMPKENLEALAKQINKMSDELSENNELKDSLKSLAESLNSSDYEKATSVIDNISTKLKQLSEENKEIRQAIDKINKELNDTTKDMQNNTQQNNSEQSNKQDNQKQNNSSPSNQQGNSNQQGQGQSSNTSGSGRGHGSIPNENIYIRDLQNISGTEVQLQGQKNSGGTLEEAEHKGDGEVGEIVSYDKVYEQYKQDALKSLNEDNIPYGMKNLVEDYFSSLSLE